VKLLVDTHIAVWAALDPGALSPRERTHLARTESAIVLSAV
jgi:PIN domain nuclease of toxin-antitoxin system